jgi:sugar lactone lactonase YvrE
MVNQLGPVAHVVLRVNGQAKLGESPTWDAHSRTVIWVDILGRRVHRYRPSDGSVRPSFPTDVDVGAAIPRRGGGLVLALASGLALIDEGSQQITDIVAVEGDVRGNRMNDAKCDAAGRLWAGTMAYAKTKGAGSLYRLDPNMQVTRVLEGLTISNGLGWSPDNRTMYFIDSAEGAVEAFDFELAAGTLTNRRRLIDVSPELGTPDGMTVDSEGGLWVAIWNGAAVHRYLPDGTLDRTVRLPCSLVTSCTFAGDLMDELYITTASHELTPAELSRQPGAGGLFSLHPGVRGVRSVPFAG